MFETKVSPKFRPRARSNSIVEAMITKDTRTNNEWKIQSDITIEVDIHLNDNSDDVKPSSLKTAMPVTLAKPDFLSTKPRVARNLSNLDNIDENDENDTFDPDASNLSPNKLKNASFETNKYQLTPRRGRRLSLPVILH